MDALQNMHIHMKHAVFCRKTRWLMKKHRPIRLSIDIQDKRFPQFWPAYNWNVLHAPSYLKWCKIKRSGPDLKDDRTPGLPPANREPPTKPFRFYFSLLIDVHETT